MNSLYIVIQERDNCINTHTKDNLYVISLKLMCLGFKDVICFKKRLTINLCIPKSFLAKEY